MRILVAGASGFVGREVVRLLATSSAAADAPKESQSPSHEIVAMVHRESSAASLREWTAQVVVADALDPQQCAALGQDYDAVISCLGASVALSHPERRGYSQIDRAAHVNLLQAVQSERLQKVVYLALFVQPGYRECAYVQAHEDVVDLLQQRNIRYTVVRPTGIFTAMAELVTMAQQGRFAVLGDGHCKTNPIHPSDVAKVCVQALSSDQLELPCGGPDVLTRREMVDLAAASVGVRMPKIRSIPPRFFALASVCVRPFNRRLGELLEFAAKVATTDCIAPAIGTQRLRDSFQNLAETLPKA